MSVSNYEIEKCRYFVNNIVKAIYLLDENHSKYIHIDNGEAYIDEIDPTPIGYEVTNVEVSENTALDERYKFTHTINFTIRGYEEPTLLDGKRYFIFKTINEDYYFLNPIFITKVESTFNLDENNCSTTFVVGTASNHPILPLYDVSLDTPTSCGYYLDGFEGLMLNDSRYSGIDSGNTPFYTNDGFKDIDVLRNFRFSRAYDGSKFVDTITFSIPIQDYKKSWHINLLEFVDNTYAALIKTKNGGQLMSGFGCGLIPNFTLSGEDENTLNMITITLTSSCSSSDGFNEVWKDPYYNNRVTWKYVPTAYECVESGIAKYLLKQPYDALDNPIDEYYALEGYENDFPDLEIIGTFEEVVTFPNEACVGYSTCESGGTLPSNIVVQPSGASVTYTFSSSTDWSIENNDECLHISPTSGNAYELYTIEVRYNCGGDVCPTYTEYTWSDVTIPSCDSGSSVQVPYTAVTHNADCTVTTSTGVSSYTASYTCNGGAPRVLKQRSPNITQLGGCPNCCASEAGSITMYANVYLEACASGETIQTRYSAVTHYADCTSSMTTGITSFTISYTCNSGETRQIGTLPDGSSIIQYGGCEICGQVGAPKFIGKYGNTELQVDCNGNVTLNRSEINANTAMTSAYVGTCVEILGSGVLSGLTNLSSVEISSSVTAISSYAFAGDTSLVISSLPPSVSNLRDNTFSGCSSITSFTLNPTMLILEANVFKDCTSLSSVTMPTSLGTIGSGCFQNTALREVTIPATVTSIGSNAFYNAPLTSVTVCATTVPSLGAEVFNGSYPIYVPCSSLQAYRTASNWRLYADRIFPIEQDCPDPSDEPAKVKIYDTYGRSGQTNCNTSTTLSSGDTKDISNVDWYYASAVTIGSCVTIVDYSTFSYFRALTSVTIPSGVTEIKDGAFASCSNLQFIKIEANSVVHIISGSSNTVFADTNDCPIYVPCGLVNAYKQTSGWDLYASRIEGYDCPDPPTPPTPSEYSGQYLTFVALEDGTFKFTGPSSTTANTLQYSLDSGTTWSTLAYDTNTPTVQSGHTIMWKATNLTTDTNGGTLRFASSGDFNVQGNVMSLISGDTFTNATSIPSTSYFAYLFNGCTDLISAENLILPATSLANNCYQRMFYGCSSLTTAPQLSATTLRQGCYQYMFYDCSSLTTAPQLPATTLANSCYNYMFKNCTSLTTAPILSASTLVDSCYRYMFQNCSNLNSITCLATDISVYSSRQSWVDGVSSSGTFTKAASMEDWGSGDSGIPTNWTVQDYQG